MSETQSRFYTSIARYYSEIFPFQPAQLKFIEQISGEIKGCKILDIGCATGELAFKLAENGAIVTGIDLNEDLLRMAESRDKIPGLLFLNRDMTNLPQYFDSGCFDHVLCFGNTLVHLQNLPSMEKFFSGISTVLKPGGKLLLQILNYDYIVENRIETLPVIETDNIRFVRNYGFQECSPIIQFITELILKSEDTTIRNETPLYALKSSELRNLLESKGFTTITFYSSFAMQPLGGNHLPLVVSCSKQ